MRCAQMNKRPAMNSQIWKQIALSWIIQYTKEQKAQTTYSIKQYGEEIRMHGTAVKDALAAAMEFAEEDEDDGY